MVTLSEIIGFLWNKVLPPGWMASYAPDGVLYHQGWAAQAMPTNEKKGGYVHAIREIAPQGGGVTGLGNPAKAFYERYYRNQQQPLLYTTAEVGTPALESGSIAEFYDIAFHRYFSAELVLDPTAGYDKFLDPYGKGTCFIYQSLITSPVSLGANRWQAYEYTEVDEIRRACKAADLPSGSLYFNIGLNNNAQFFDNTLDIKFRYPQRKFANWRNASQQTIQFTYAPAATEPPDPPVNALGFPQGLLDPDTLMFLGGLFFFTQLPDPIMPPYPAWPNPALDVTHPVVVRLVLDDIRDLARRYGRVGADQLPVANFIIGGEFTLGYGPPFSLANVNPPNSLRRFQLPITSEEDCRNCQPLAPYSAELDLAFREYLKEIVGLVDPMGGLDIIALNARWGLQGLGSMIEFGSEEEVEPSKEDWCKSRVGVTASGGPSYKAVQDYRAFLERLERDLYVIQYAEAKKHAMHGRHGMRGPFDAEQAWLNSDLLLSGEWYAAQAQIEQPLERALYYQASTCRIGGKPAGFPIASPPSTQSEGSLQILSLTGKSGYALPPDEWSNPPMGKAIASSAFEPRCITREHFFFLYQDILTAGVFGFGYHRLYGFGVFGAVERELHSTSGTVRTEPFDGVQTFVDILEQFKGTIQPKYLRFMTPYQRIAVHLDEYQLVDFAEQVADGTMRFAATFLPWLDEHHFTYAMLSDPRVFVRLFSKHSLRASVTISSFHKNLDDDLMEQYVQLVAASSGVVVVLADDEGYANVGSAPSGSTLTELYPGSAWRWQPWDDPNPAMARVFVYVIDDEENIGTGLGPPATPLDDILGELGQHIAKVAARVVDVQLDNGLTVTPADVRTNFVTDGLNYLIALTNVGQGDQPDGTATGIATGTLSLAAAMRIAADPGTPGMVYTYGLTEVTSSLTSGRTPPLEPGMLTLTTDVSFQRQNPTSDVIIDFELKPRETKLIYLGAQVDGLDGMQMQLASTQMRSALLDLQGQGYEVSDGMRALDYVDDMLGPVTQAPLERVLAGLIQVKNMIFLRIDKGVDDATFGVAAARLGLPGSTMIEPVSGEVQILHVLNGHEEQGADDLSGSTSRVTIEPTTLKHWSFGQIREGAQPTLEPPRYVTSLTGSQPGRDPIEVHVHDPALGTESFLLVSPDPREPVLPPTILERPSRHIRPTTP